MPNLPTPTIRTTLCNLSRSALELLFPIHCVGCGREGKVICETCVDGLRKLEQLYCDTCAHPGVQDQCSWCLEHPSKIEGIRSPYLFEGPARETVHRLEYSFL
jgi:predicted amidophosphoribosyltransferase